MRDNRVSGIRYRQHPRAEADFCDRKPHRPVGLACKHRRRLLQVDLDLSDSSQQNFSAGLAGAVDGVFIATHRGAKLGDKVELTINLPESLTTVFGEGEIHWVREYNEQSDAPPGLGVSISYMDGEEIEAVEEFLQIRDPLLFAD